MAGGILEVTFRHADYADMWIDEEERSTPRHFVHHHFCGLVETMNNVRIRPAVSSERKELEALQWRASLSNTGDRDALLANPDAIELTIEQIEMGGVFVAEWNGLLAGFSAVLPRADGEANWMPCLSSPPLEGAALDAYWSTALHVIGNPHAEAFYLACGFEMTGTTETRFGTGLLLRKILAS